MSGRYNWFIGPYKQEIYLNLRKMFRGGNPGMGYGVSEEVGGGGVCLTPGSQ